MIDFGGVGDPACDLTVSWTLLDGPGRAVFRRLKGADEAMWARARGWALWNALITLAAPGVTPDTAAHQHRILDAILKTDHPPSETDHLREEATAPIDGCDNGPVAPSPPDTQVWGPEVGLSLGPAVIGSRA